MLKIFQLKINNAGIEFDRNAISKRTGWSVYINSHYIFQFEKYFIIALLKMFLHLTKKELI